MKNVQEMQELKIKNITPISGYALSMQIKQKLKEGENVNMETELSNFFIAYNEPNPCADWLFNKHSTCQFAQGLC